MAFKLQLPDTTRIHPMFHVSQLKLAVGLHEVQPKLPKELQGPAGNCYRTEILDRHNNKDLWENSSIYHTLG